MILELLLASLGILLVLFVPGYLLALLLFPDHDAMSKAILGIGLSLVITITASFLLSYIGILASVRGITSLSLVLTLLLVSVILLEIIYVMSRGGRHRPGSRQGW
ncbi:MAG: DUF1616 domain-containing protein [DPANN group archaeon]|nr:DUF1616 domain-containing protein [DPANN group archaeon]